MDRIKKELLEISKTARLAHEEICGLADGSRKWRMCIPVDKSDSDIVLSDALNDLERLQYALIDAVRFIQAVEKTNPAGSLQFQAAMELDAIARRLEMDKA